MSHTVHPYAHRLGILRDWKSRWFATSGTYAVFQAVTSCLGQMMRGPELEKRATTGLRGHMPAEHDPDLGLLSRRARALGYSDKLLR